MPNEILSRAIDAVASREHLTADHAATVLAEIMEGRAGEVQTAAFLIALRAKGETVPELVGLARTMRSLATPVEIAAETLLDTAGTGGGPSTLNISTTAALIAAAAGCSVAKHGNRSSTSRSGSADLLEALGVRIELAPDAVGRCIEQVGFGFMFAPAHHAAMRHIAPVRRELAVRTIFNFLGPLTNPAGATRQLLGVADRRYQETIAEALAGLGCDHAMVVAGEDGLDELTISGATRVIEVLDGNTSEWYLTAEEVGLTEAGLQTIAGRRAHRERGRGPRRARRRARPAPRRLPAQRRRGDLRRRRGRAADRGRRQGGGGDRHRCRGRDPRRPDRAERRVGGRMSGSGRGGRSRSAAATGSLQGR